MKLDSTNPTGSSLRERQVRFLRALGHPARLRILEIIGSREICGCELEPQLGLDQSTVSRHLQILRREGILEARRDGVRVLYRVRDLALHGLLRQVRDLVRAEAERELDALGGGAPHTSP